MNSKIFHAELYHQRCEPVIHEFHYPLYLYVFDLAELPRLDREVPLFGYNRRALASVHDRDYLSDAPGSIADKLDRLLVEEGLAAAVEKVYLVTATRYAGYIFNPVSFYYCLAADGGIAAIVAEVNNTFGERQIYVLRDPHPAPEGYAAAFGTTKRFHVSPFFPRAGEYEFFFSDPGDTLDIRINYWQAGRLRLKTRLTGPCRSLTGRSLAATVAARPIQAVMTMPRIYYQAARLYFGKGVRFYPKPPPLDRRTMTKAPSPARLRIFQAVVGGVLAGIQEGSLTLVLPDGRHKVYGCPGTGPAGTIEVRHLAFFRKLFFGADIGLGESFMDGDWTSPDLVEALAVLARNMNALNRRTRALPGLSRFFDIMQHRRRSNTLTGARQNIGAHYDTSNDFFRLILDPTMTYSCGLFEPPATDLHQAQLAKYGRVCDLAGIQAGDQVLEIGSGWGGFATEAVRRTDCAVTTTTISREQYAYVTAEVARQGLAGKITVLDKDYRHLRGRFDRLVSIEMLEAVGHEYYGRFFAAVEALLKPGGRAVIQVITIPHERYHAYRRRVEWIQKYIFPGGMLPSKEILEENIHRHTRLKVVEVNAIGAHYAPTLAAWRDNLLAHREEIAAMGFTPRDLRMWEYYFSYTEAGFATGIIDNIHLVLEKPGPDRRSPV